MDVTFQFDWLAALRSIPHLLPGIPWTLVISFGGLAIGFVIGIIFGLLRISPLRWLRFPAILYIEVFRGTPILVQVLFIFYGLPQILGGLDADARLFIGQRLRQGGHVLVSGGAVAGTSFRLEIGPPVAAGTGAKALKEVKGKTVLAAASG